MLAASDKKRLLGLLRQGAPPRISAPMVRRLAREVRNSLHDSLLLNMWMVIVADRTVRRSEAELFRTFCTAFKRSKEQVRRVKRRAELKYANRGPILLPVRKAQRKPRKLARTLLRDITKKLKRDLKRAPARPRQLELVKFFRARDKRWRQHYLTDVEKKAWAEVGEQLDQDRVEVAVVGVTSAGKTALLNALMGLKLLPEDVRATTNIITHIIPSSRPRVEVAYEDGSRESLSLDKPRPRKRALDLLCTIPDENRNAGNRLKVKQVGGVRLFVKVPHLHPSIELVDTPGLNAGNMFSHEKLAITYFMERPDALIYAFSLKNNFKAKDFETVQQITATNRPILFVQNMVDAIRRSRRGGKVMTEQYQLQEHRRIVNKRIGGAMGHEAPLFQVSAAFALRAFTGEQRLPGDDWRLADFPGFIEAINDIGHRLRERKVQGMQASLLEFVSKARMERKRRLEVLDLGRDAAQELLSDTLARYAMNREVLEAIDKDAKRQRGQLKRELSGLRDSLMRQIGSAHVTKSNHEAVARRILEQYPNGARRVLSSFEALKKSVFARMRQVNSAIPEFHEPFSVPAIPRITSLEAHQVKKKGIWSGIKRFFGSKSGYTTERRLNRSAFNQKCKGAVKAMHVQYSNYLELLFDRLNERCIAPMSEKVSALEQNEQEIKEKLDSSELDREQLQQQLKVFSDGENKLAHLTEAKGREG